MIWRTDGCVTVGDSAGCLRGAWDCQPHIKDDAGTSYPDPQSEVNHTTPLQGFIHCFSTFDCDVILIQEGHLEAAVQLLRSELSRGVHGLLERIHDEEVIEEGSAGVTPKKHRSEDNCLGQLSWLENRESINYTPHQWVVPICCTCSCYIFSYAGDSGGASEPYSQTRNRWRGLLLVGSSLSGTILHL